MNRKKNRKAFTIVELVIVIAVIAVLAVVLVPTFSDVIAKSQDSRALQEAKNAYTNYVMESDGDTPVFMVYQLDERFVAIHNGVPIGVFADKESALGAMMEEYDVNNLADTGDGKLWVYEAGGAGNEENIEPAEVVGDSLSFTPVPEAEEFIKNSTLPVIRIFNDAYYHRFRGEKTFQNCLEECQQETYVVYDPIFENPSGLGLADFVMNIDLSTGKTDSTDFWRWFDPVTCERACRYALFTHVLFEATPATAQFTSLEIKEIYCFSAENSLLRMYIVTNQGEYVYCYNYDFDVVISQGAIIEHLMPASKFYELAKTSEHMDYYGYNVAQWPEEYRISEVDWDEYIRSNFQK